MAARRPLLLVLVVLVAAANALAQGLPGGRPDQLGFSPERLARIDSVMRRYVDSGRVAGVVTLVARHGRVVQLGAYGWADREAGRRMTPDAIFRIASQSKALTSVAVMALVEEGRLRVSDPVSL
ncbi:MAG: serine hydrolase domain-containing protein, partial [Gemmatimonadales bacterium]